MEEESHFPGLSLCPSGVPMTQVGARLHVGAVGTDLATAPFWVAVLCPKARLHWRVFFLLKRGMGYRPLFAGEHQEQPPLLVRRMAEVHNVLHKSS